MIGCSTQIQCTSAPRGVALLISIIFTSVVLAVGATLLDIAYKQVLLASSAKNSQYAFYNADSALECALYFDQKLNAFDYAAPLPQGTVVCTNNAVTNYSSTASGGTRMTSFSVPCRIGAGTAGTIAIYKKSDGTTDIFANGYSSCDESLPTRIERGLKAHY